MWWDDEPSNGGFHKVESGGETLREIMKGMIDEAREDRLDQLYDAIE